MDELQTTRDNICYLRTKLLVRAAGHQLICVLCKSETAASRRKGSGIGIGIWGKERLQPAAGRSHLREPGCAAG